MQAARTRPFGSLKNRSIPNGLGSTPLFSTRSPPGRSPFCPLASGALCLPLASGALLGAAFPRRSCSISARLRAPSGAAFPRRSFLAPQSRRRRALRLAPPSLLSPGGAAPLWLASTRAGGQYRAAKDEHERYADGGG